MTKLSLILFIFCVYNGIVLTLDDNCPEKCVCRKIAENSNGLKVKCGGLPQVKLTSIKEIDFKAIKSDIVQLYVHIEI